MLTIELWIPELLATGRKAAELVMEIYGQAFEVNFKEDHSPVTQADVLADKIIREGLAFTGLPSITEESFVSAEHIPLSESYWVVDPIDGTRDFVQRTGEFTVNIALVHQQQPVLGLLIAPAVKNFPGGAWLGWVGRGIWHWPMDQAWALTKGKHAAGCIPPTKGMLASRSDFRASGEDMKAHFGLASDTEPVKRVGSSLKFAWIAAGLATWYPRAQRLSAWDLAAGHALVLAAGGRVEQWEAGKPLMYALPKVEMPSFVAYAPGVEALPHERQRPRSSI